MSIYESIKALEIKTSMVCNLTFARNTMLPCFFSFFLFIDLYFLIPAVITQIFNPTANLQHKQQYLLKKQKLESKRMQ